LLYEVPGSM